MKHINRRKQGSKYEQIAADFLKRKNYKILERNWTSRWCEIDIIALPYMSVPAEAPLVFVEVKFTSNRFYDISHVVSRKKLISQKKAINSYLNSRISNNLLKYSCFRFDLILITKLENKFLLQHFINIKLV